MSHTVCGIDLGASSVKLAFLEVGFRATTLRRLAEVPIPPGDAPLLDRQLEVVRDALGGVAGEVTPYLAIPGDQLSIRMLELPFTDPRKIDQVVGYELEGQIVNAIEDVVFDHLVVGTRAEGSTVLVAAAKRDELGALIEKAEAAGIHPRALFAAPVMYRTLFPTPADAEVEATPCYAVLDFGQQRTNVCIVRGSETIYARTIRRGGEHLTAAIAHAFSATRDEAEQAKCIDAYLASAERPATTALAQKLDAVLREALVPTIRELRQTIASFQASARLGVDRLLVVGGGGRLGGLLPFLESQLEIATEHPSVRSALDLGGAKPVASRRVRARAEQALFDEDGAELDPDAEGREPAQSDSHALAAAIALAASRGSREIDFRRGPFVFRASFSILRQKGWHLAALAAALLVAGSVDVGAKLSNLGAERKQLDKEMKTATQELFGQPRTDAEAVAQLLRKGFREELAPLPKATAFDLLDQISRKVPAADKVKLDIAELDIRPKKTFIKGTVDSGAAVDEIATKLKEIDCFDEVTKGAITEVSDGGKQFSLSINTRCP